LPTASNLAVPPSGSRNTERDGLPWAPLQKTITRGEIATMAEPIIRKCLREFGDYTKDEVSDEAFARYTIGMLRPDVRRVSLIASMALSALGPNATGEGLELGSGYGYLLFPMARLFPLIRWTGIDHPNRSYQRREEFAQAFRDYRCQFVSLDILHSPLPFPDAHFSVATFSEVLEHLPLESLSFVLSELARVLRPGGLLIITSPNQASLENRLRLLNGSSILAMPDDIAASGLFGHIRLYTPSEIVSAMAKLGFSLERGAAESNNSAYRGPHKSWRRRVYRFYEALEGFLPFLRTMSDTWFMAFRKNAVAQ